jgi:glycosyltransferase involved in cell wall biosynthesis
MTSTRRPTILTLLGPYWPAADANGPVQSILNLIRALTPEFEFKVVGRDRPYGSSVVATEVGTGRWFAHEGGQLRFESPSALNLPFFIKFLRDTPHDILYINSLFEREFAIVPLIAHRLLRNTRPTIVAPRGELNAGALRIKRTRKTAYLSLAKSIRLHSHVTFQATSNMELDEIRTSFPRRPIVVCPNIAPLRRPSQVLRRAGEVLRIVYLSRIAEKKNLKVALDSLAQVAAPVSFDIYGPISEQRYWDECQARIRSLPANISVSYRGEVANNDVPDKLAEYDLFFLPTAGENFGHAIVEALAAGVPVLISDCTPWKVLEPAYAGFDIPLGDVGRFARTIERFASFDSEQRRTFSDGAAAYIRRAIDPDRSVGMHRSMFNAALASVQ